MMGYTGISADRIYEFIAVDIINCDFLTPMGFMQVVTGVMRLHSGGVFLGAKGLLDVHSCHAEVCCASCHGPVWVLPG